MPSMPAKTAEPGRGLSRSERNSAEGLATSARPRAGHLEDADLVGGAEAVLDRAQDAELVAALALEIEHGVDHVLDHARAGDLAVLGDMADEDDRDAAALGEGDELVGGGADLGDGAGRAVDVVGPHRLDRVDDGERRALGLERGQDVAQVGLGGEPEGRVGQAEALRRACGPGRWLPRPRCRSPGRRAAAKAAAACSSSVDLPMPGSPPTRMRRGRDEAAAEDAVELADAGERRGAAAARRWRDRRARRARPRAGRGCGRPGRRRGRLPRRCVFQAPQASQRPAHLVWAAPQAVQVKVGRRVIGRRHAAVELRQRPCPRGCRSSGTPRGADGRCSGPAPGKRMRAGSAAPVTAPRRSGRSARPWMNWSR